MMHAPADSSSVSRKKSLTRVISPRSAQAVHSEQPLSPLQLSQYQHKLSHHSHQPHHSQHQQSLHHYTTPLNCAPKQQDLTLTPPCPPGYDQESNNIAFNEKTVRDRKIMIRDRLVDLLGSRDNRCLSFRSVGNDEMIKLWCKKLKLLYVIQSFPEFFTITREENNCYFVRLRDHISVPRHPFHPAQESQPFQLESRKIEDGRTTRDVLQEWGGATRAHTPACSFSTEVTAWRTFHSLFGLVRWGIDPTNHESVDEANPIKVSGIPGLGQLYGVSRVFPSFDKALKFLLQRREILVLVRKSIDSTFRDSDELEDWHLIIGLDIRHVAMCIEEIAPKVLLSSPHRRLNTQDALSLKQRVLGADQTADPVLFLPKGRPDLRCGTPSCMKNHNEIAASTPSDEAARCPSWLGSLWGGDGGASDFATRSQSFTSDAGDECSTISTGRVAERKISSGSSATVLNRSLAPFAGQSIWGRQSLSEEIPCSLHHMSIDPLGLAREMIQKEAQQARAGNRRCTHDL